jgi:hypothetical protein
MSGEQEPITNRASNEPIVNLVTLGKRAREEAEEALVVLPPVEKKRRTDSDSLLSIKKELVARVDATRASPARLELIRALDTQSVKKLQEWARPDYVLRYKESTKQVPEPGSVRNETYSVPVYMIKIYW